MLAPDGRARAAAAAGYEIGQSPALVRLSRALEELTAASDEVTEAVTGHDRTRLETANAKAEKLVAEIQQLTAALSDDDRAMIRETGIKAICERLAVGARRNACLIENAWATDAALMRLIIGAGRDSVYATPASPAYVDRGA